MLRRLLIIAVVLTAAIVVLSSVATRSLMRRYPAPGTMISVGTHRLHIYCMGGGTPTIIIEPGIGSGWETWGRVVPELAKSARVCVYDRSGYGWSEAGSVTPSAGQLAGELHSLLAGAGIPGPYLLVAHSFGGYIARAFAAPFSNELTGVVLVDPSSEDESRVLTLGQRFRGLLPPNGLLALVPFFRGENALPPELEDAPAPFRDRYLVGFSYDESAAVRRESALMGATEAEVRGMAFPRELPLVVISATNILISDGVVGKRDVGASPHHVEIQKKLAGLSARGTQVVVHSGHLVQLDRPDVVINAVRQICHEH